MAKVVALNMLYHTRIRDIDLEPLARHIARSDIDSLLHQESLLAVDRLCNCSEIKRRYFSFATKYCNWSKPKAYPIYDWNVDECLWWYQCQERFADPPFHRKDLREFTSLHRVIEAFLKAFDLDFSFKDIDKFLWLQGMAITSPPSAEVNWGPPRGVEVW